MLCDVEIALPPEPADRYLTWVAWWRGVEEAMAQRPVLARHASIASAPFLRGRVAEFVSSCLLTDVGRQAREALREGRVAAPVVRGDANLWARAAGTMAAQARWLEWALSHLEIARVLELEPQEAGVTDLQEGVLRAIRAQSLEHGWRRLLRDVTAAAG